MSKYRSKKTTIDGITFDSVKEARRYSELILLEKAGRIKDLRRQWKYVLIPCQYGEIDGKRMRIERECTYVADFVYCDTENGEIVVEDVKGFRTKDYILKRKMMLYLRGIRIKEV